MFNLLRQGEDVTGTASGCVRFYRMLQNLECDERRKLKVAALNHLKWEVLVILNKGEEEEGGWQGM